MLLQAVGVIVLISACIATDQCTCDGTDPTNSDNCEHLFCLFENSLLANGGNLFKIRNLFNPPTAGFPKLVNITYHLHFTVNRSIPFPQFQHALVQLQSMIVLFSTPPSQQHFVMEVPLLEYTHFYGQHCYIRFSYSFLY